MCSFRILIVHLVFGVCFRPICSFDPIDEGSPCKTETGSSGICREVKRCPLALAMLEEKTRHNLERCGFNGLEEVVCCPSVVTRETSTWENGGGKIPSRVKNKRKCEIECESMLKLADSKPDITLHITGGENADPGEFPHMVALGLWFDSKQENDLDWLLCAGTLISSKFVMTAAHCFLNIQAPDLKKVRMGVIDLNDTSAQDYDVAEYTLHDKYDPRTRHHDIALVELKNAVKFTKEVQPACLFTENTDPKGLIVTGWGVLDPENQKLRPSKLQKALLMPVPVTQCNVTLLSKAVGTSKTIIRNQICAWSNTSDACQGDSGGPLQIQRSEGDGFNVVGIVSYGAGCQTSTPGIYTRVSRYLDWIEKIVWPD